MKRRIWITIAVIGTLVLLGALLMPSLNRARSEARKTSHSSYYPYIQQQGWVPPGNQQEFNTESYDEVVHNPFRLVAQHPLSTFGTDVDTASYANVRRFLNNWELPPAGAVRVEEMINYFDYEYPEPNGEHPFSVAVEVAQCPWRPERRLARIGLKGRTVQREDRPPANLVFLLDVSGSMSDPNKLPLVKKAMRMLLHQLKPSDRVAIAVYAGSSGLVLPSTPARQRRVILDAFTRLQAGGSTNGCQGIQLAYREATGNFIEGGINRVVLCTDGDFNVGITDEGSLVDLIESRARSGVFLSVMGFGMGNYKDSTLEKLADRGNGNYGYIDSEGEARKVFVDQVAGTLVTIAKDVKIQVEFNPKQVAAYRLIGYENRMLAAEDFNDDTKDAGEIGAGHSVTALYQIIPAEAGPVATAGDRQKYQTPSEPTGEHGDELMTVKLRYKEPDGHRSKLLSLVAKDEGTSFEQASVDFRFAAAVAAFGMILRESPYCGTARLSEVISWAEETVSTDSSPYKKEFVELAYTALVLR